MTHSSDSAAAQTAGASLSGAAHKERKTRKKSAQAFWWKQLHQWHWISAAVSLVGMLLFAITGITLNHAGSIEAKPAVSTRDAQVPRDLIAGLTTPAGKGDKIRGPLPAQLKDWLGANLKLSLGDADAEWSANEIYVSLPRPGGDAWLTVDRASGAAHYERTDRGWIAYLNDLHKGRNSGTAWFWFIDIFAVACVVFSITGLLLLQLHAGKRPMTWPTVAIGLLIPVLVAIFLIH